MTNKTIIDDATTGSSPLKTDILNLGQKSFAYVIGHIASRAISFLLLPLYTNTLTPADFGVLSLAFTFAAFAIIIYHFGIDSALLKFYTGENRQEQKKVFSTVYLTQLAAIAAFSPILYLARLPLAEFLLGVSRPDWIIILGSILIMDALWAHPMHVLRATGRANRYALFSLSNALVIAMGNFILLTVMDMGITGALLANLIASTFLFLVNLPTVFSNISLSGWSGVTLKKMLRFGLPFLPAGLFTMIMELSDRYFLRWLTNMETVGLYSAGYKLGLAMLLVVAGFSLGWQPFFLNRGKKPGAERVFARVSTYLLILLFWILFTVSAWIDNIVRIPIGSITVFGPEYWSATEIVPLILLGYVFFATYVLQLPGIHLTNRTNWVMLYRGSGAVTKLGLNGLLIPIWGTMGAATATTIAFAVMSAVTYIFNRRFYLIPYEWGRLLRLAILLGTGFPLLFIWPADNTRNIILTLWIPVGFVLSRGVQKEEWAQLKRMMGR